MLFGIYKTNKKNEILEKCLIAVYEAINSDRAIRAHVIEYGLNRFKFKILEEYSGTILNAENIIGLNNKKIIENKKRMDYFDQHWNGEYISDEEIRRINDDYLARRK